MIEINNKNLLREKRNSGFYLPLYVLKGLEEYKSVKKLSSTSSAIMDLIDWPRVRETIENPDIKGLIDELITTQAA